MNMKTKISLLSLFALFTISLFSCKNDDDTPGPSASVNDFVWKAMNLWYYWQEDVPDLADNRFSNDSEYTSFLNSQQTDELFYNLLYDYGNTDRFSWVVEDYHQLDNAFAGINQTYGMDYGLVYAGPSTNVIFGYVQYVLPNSPASSTGFHRGDIFTRINGTQLTDSNYGTLLSGSSATFGMGFLQDGQLHDSDEEISIAKTQMQENPVYLTTVINIDTYKIGYLVYNGFRANFNDELNNAIGQLQAQGITDLVIDLRYNGGGSVQTSAYLGSMVTGQFDGQDFTRLTFNQKMSENNSVYKFENQGKIFNDDLEESGSFTLNHLNLNHLYVLTTHGSASASEMLISCLRPYIEVTTIGTTTYGKTVGSITLYDSPSSYYTSNENVNPGHTWAMQPIVFGSRNSQDQPSPTQGILPDVEINEINYLENLKPLGDVSEPLLEAAISEITGDHGKTTRMMTSPNAILFKTSKNLEKFSSEMYLDKGFELNP